MAIKAGDLIKVYALRSPATGEVRYVGKSCNPHRRLTEHARGRWPVGCWIRSLRAQGLEPDLVILDECPGEQVDDAERAAIVLTRACGHRLLNLTEGGDGGHVPEAQTPEARAKRARSNRGQRRSPEAIARMREAQSKIKRKGGVPPRHLGESNNATPLTADDVRIIRKRYADGASRRELASTFGVSYQTVWNIATRKTWTHVE